MLYPTRNFCIIAHIDHGKSTLADRMLEHTHTIEGRLMKEQVLDSMDLERERGITIKMQPVRMLYKMDGADGSGEYILNLIDTPGHIDFAYEVSRALRAVEGAVVLVDATQGMQAQTLSTLEMAKEAGLTLIPVVSKIDSPNARVSEVKREIAEHLNCDESEVMETSGKTGAGVEELLSTIVKRVPAPESRPEAEATGDLRSLVFDFKYSNHRGVVMYVRVMNGTVAAGDEVELRMINRRFKVLEVGTFSPRETPAKSLSAGDIGYIVSGIKEPGVSSVGDTLTMAGSDVSVLEGYKTPSPLVWVSIFPESQDDFTHLRQSLERLRLSDASLSYEEESSHALGRGFRCGFLGMLHLEIITERLRREFNLTELVVTTPSTTYEVVDRSGERELVYAPSRFPDDGNITEVLEPMVNVTIIAPNEHIGVLMQILYDHEADLGESDSFGDGRVSFRTMMPLRELMRGFFDKVKSATSGYASIAYELADMRPADVTRLDILVAGDTISPLSRVISRKRAYEEAKQAVDKMKEVVPRQLFAMKIQGYARGRIMASADVAALKKDVTAKLYGGDFTRKKKLLEIQKAGKKRMKSQGKVNIPHDVYLKMMKRE